MAIIVAMIASVSWPHYRAGRAQSIWRYAPEAILHAGANDAALYGDAVLDAARLKTLRAVHAGYNAGTVATGASVAGTGTGDDATPFYAAVAAAGGKVNALLGFARTSLNVPIPYARVVLRNIRTGQIVGRTIADAYGQFSFLDIDANSYVVELLGADGSVVAVSPMVSMLIGDVRRTELRAAASTAAVLKSLGNSLGAAVPEATMAAAATGITAVSSSAVPQESTRH